METSDSECFESADEDFESDQEENSIVTKKTVESNLEEQGSLAKANETQVCDNVKIISRDKTAMSEKLNSKDNKTTDNKIAEEFDKKCDLLQKPTAKKGDTATQNQPEHTKPCNLPTTSQDSKPTDNFDTTKNTGDVSEPSETKKKDISKLIDKYMTYETRIDKPDGADKKSEELLSVGKGDGDSRNKNENSEPVIGVTTKADINPIEIDDDIWGDDTWGEDSNVVETVKQPKTETKPESPKPTKYVNRGFAKPPARVECWEPGMDYHQEKSPKPTKNVNRGFAKPPARVECWEPGMNFDQDKYGKKAPNEPEPVRAPLAEVQQEKQEAHKPPEDHKDLPKDEENLWDDEEIEWKDDTTEGIARGAIGSEKEKKQENLWNDEEGDLWNEDDAWEPVSNTPSSRKPEEARNPQAALDNLAKETEGSGWGSWGSWGLSSVLSSATASVSTLTSHVSQGISTVLESGIGVPDPEELARQHKEQSERLKEANDPNQEEATPNPTHPSRGLSNFGNLVSGVSHITKLVEQTSTKVISGGLDTLETIGKKTMEVLQENDPGLKRKRAFLKIDSDKPSLSQMLREAKAKSEHDSKSEVRTFKKPNYESIFDDHQGLVHLEALEMLSKQCDIKLETLCENLTGTALTDMQETMEQVKELCELPDEEDDEMLTPSEVKEHFESMVNEINVPVKYITLLDTWEEVEDWLEKVDCSSSSEDDVHKQAIESLAHLTAIAVEQYHKIGELLLVKDHRSTADEADSLVQLTTTLTTLISNIASKFSRKLTDISQIANNKEAVNELITNVFFEAANSSSYIQDAFQLIIPVLQVGAV